MLSWVLMFRFYFFYQHPECFVSVWTLTLCYIKWRILDVYLGRFLLLKFLWTHFIFWSFKSLARESDTSLVCFGGACCVPHWKCSIWNAWSLVSFWGFCFFPCFFFTFPPQNDFIEGKMHSSQPQTCWMCIFCIFLHLFDWFSMLVSLETLGHFPNSMFLNCSRSLNAS